MGGGEAESSGEAGGGGAGVEGMLRAFLAERDVPCPACGYNLRGLETARCPECDEALELRVNLTEPRQGPYIAGVIGLSVGIGFSGIMFLWALVLWLVAGLHLGGLMADAWPLPLVLVLLSAALWGWVRGRPRLRRMPWRGRATLAVGCWVLSLGVTMLVLIRAAW